MINKNFLKYQPRVLLHKVFLSAFIGLGCLAIGGIYFIYTNDFVFLILSCLITIFSFIRSINLYRTIVAKKYDVLEATCINISKKPLQNQLKIRVMEQNKSEKTLFISKEAKIKNGYHYRFYMLQDQYKSENEDCLNSNLATTQCLGYEEIEKHTSNTFFK